MDSKKPQSKVKMSFDGKIGSAGGGKGGITGSASALGSLGAMWGAANTQDMMDDVEGASDKDGAGSVVGLQFGSIDTKAGRGKAVATTDGGLSGEHPAIATRRFLVGPATEKQFNTIKPSILPFACWRCNDIRFEFNCSFVKPDTAEELKHLAMLRRSHPGASMSIFGHTDSVGNDHDNKQLSGRRAAAVYGLLTRNADVWEKIYKKEQWDIKTIQTMLMTIKPSAVVAKSQSSAAMKLNGDAHTGLAGGLRSGLNAKVSSSLSGEAHSGLNARASSDVSANAFSGVSADALSGFGAAAHSGTAGLQMDSALALNARSSSFDVTSDASAGQPTVKCAEPYYADTIDGIQGPKTTAAIKQFQSDHELTSDGIVGPKTRRELFLAYMDTLCRDANGQPYRLNRQADFLAGGEDADGKGDYQGCGGFNPNLVFSQREEDRLSDSQNRDQRNAANGPNRRVVAFLFRPGVRVSPEFWPCPCAKDGVADCKKRFWSNGQERRTRRQPDEARLYLEARDTFACRFYDRLSSRSPCENIRAQSAVDVDVPVPVPLVGRDQFIAFAVFDQDGVPLDGNFVCRIDGCSNPGALVQKPTWFNRLSTTASVELALADLRVQSKSPNDVKIEGQ